MMTNNEVQARFLVLLDLVAQGSSADGAQRTVAKGINEALDQMPDIVRAMAWGAMIAQAEQRPEQKAVSLTMCAVPQRKAGIQLWS